MINIDVINRTSHIRDVKFLNCLSGLQAQITEDLVPIWGQDKSSTLHLVGRHAQPTSDHWKVWVMDHSDIQGDLGYHQDKGIPEAYIFAMDDIRYGSSITVTLSHELCEMIVDPLTTLVSSEINGKQYAIEVSDPVEADEDGYLKDGVLVSNFVTPAYFMMDTGTVYDFSRKLTGTCPLMLPGGYLLYYQNNGWYTTTARHTDGSLSHRVLKKWGRQETRAYKG